MEPGVGQGLQGRLQGIFSKINREQLRNRVTDWQKKLVATASSRFSFDSTAPESSGIDQDPNLPIVDVSEQENYDNEPIEEENEATDELTASNPPGARPDTLREGIMEGEFLSETKLLSPVGPLEEPPRNKSPVQLWVDSLIDEHERRDEEMPPIGEADQNDAEVESFTLGAEAPGVVCPRPYPFVQVTAHCGGSDAGSHCSSMESLLEARKPDPEEMLLELGFGGCEEPDIISRIPERFLRPSSMKGVVIDDFIRHQQKMVHQFQSGFSGYRGLTDPLRSADGTRKVVGVPVRGVPPRSMDTTHEPPTSADMDLIGTPQSNSLSRGDHQCCFCRVMERPSHAMPSGIVGKIMDRLLEAEVERQNQAAYYQAQQQAHLKHLAIQHCQASQTQGGYSPKLARLAHNLMAKMKSAPKEMSVLSPENRNWYESQGDKSPEPAGRRIIIGHHSYTFAKDGNLMEDSKKTVNGVTNVGSSTTGTDVSDDRSSSESEGKPKSVDELVNSDHKARKVSSTTDCQVSRVLFEVEEEEEDEVAVKDEDTGNTSVSFSLLTESAVTDTRPSSGDWPSSYSVITGDGQISADSDSRRSSLPEGTRPSIEKRRASLLEGRKLHEERRGSLEVERCSSCGSRKSSVDLNEPAVKRSRSPVPVFEKEQSFTDLMEQSLFADDQQCASSCRNEGTRQDEVSSVEEKRPSLTESELNEWVDFKREDVKRQSASGQIVTTLSLMEEMNLQSPGDKAQELIVSSDTVRHAVGDEDVSEFPLLVRRRSNASCSHSPTGDKSTPGSSGPSTPSSHSFDQEEAELEYRNLILLTTHLPDVATIVGSEEEFLALTASGRRQLQVAVLEEALGTYQKRLKELDLRGHLRDLLTGQLHKVTDLLDSTSAPSVPTIMKQMTTLLRHQAALRQELDLNERRAARRDKKDS